MFRNETALRLATEARAIARRLGISGPLGQLRDVVSRLRGRRGYELAFEEGLRATLRVGDVVWDIGANRGLYTEVFSEAVGPSGVVCAFEPVPSCFIALERRCGGRDNVRLFNFALGEETTTLPMFLSDDPLGTTHSLAGPSSLIGKGRTLDVRVMTGDEIALRGEAPSPAVIKMDVEGFEEEVLAGLGSVLSRPRCRAVFCEVHFAILERRGHRHAPARIQRLLNTAGFKVRWVDASHIAAHKSA